MIVKVAGQTIDTQAPYPGPDVTVERRHVEDVTSMKGMEVMTLHVRDGAKTAHFWVEVRVRNGHPEVRVDSLLKGGGNKNVKLRGDFVAPSVPVDRAD